MSDLRHDILELVKKHAIQTHGQNLPLYDRRKPKFVAGSTPIPYAGRVFDEDEVAAAVSSVLDFWLTLGPEGEKFESRLAGHLGVRKSILTNSGSSANLLAISALCSPKVPRDRRILPRDEVITVAAGFPTTVAPIIQCGAVPVFVDSDPITGNVKVSELEEAYKPGLTKAVMLAHTLGNPFDIRAVREFCTRYRLWLVEDNCDALGSLYHIDGSTGATGSYGDLSTQSFYPPHHITLGEGGAVNIVSDGRFKPIIESIRDWGRDCWCPSGKDDTCNRRFGWQLGEMPEGYDHKYIYSHFGYNLKPLDIQAAIGCVQLNRLEMFTGARRDNWNRLRQGLQSFSDWFDFSLPTHATKWHGDGSYWWDDSGCKTTPSWFGFMLLVKPGGPFTRTELARHLDYHKIGNRMLFGGNLTKQPAYVGLKKENPSAFRVVGNLAGADRIMEEALFIGVYPGLTHEMTDYVISVIGDLCNSKH